MKYNDLCFILQAYRADMLKAFRKTLEEGRFPFIIGTVLYLAYYFSRGVGNGYGTEGNDCCTFSGGPSCPCGSLCPILGTCKGTVGGFESNLGESVGVE